MLGNVMKGGWKDDRQSQLRRTEARWPWRLEILALVRAHHPAFPQGTFDRRWRLIQSALEALHDADPAPHRALEMAEIIVANDAATARRIARRYFAPYDHFFSWLEP